MGLNCCLDLIKILQIQLSIGWACSSIDWTRQILKSSFYSLYVLVCSRFANCSKLLEPNKEEKWEVTSVYRLYRLEQSPSKGPISHALDWSASGRNCRPSSDELFGCLSRVPLDTFSLVKLGENNFCHSYWKLPLQGDAFWIEKCRLYLLENND